MMNGCDIYSKGLLNVDVSCVQSCTFPYSVLLCVNWRLGW